MPMAVPMSPDQVLKKRRAIFFQQSQKDGVMFQGDDAREFWVRAEERNNETKIITTGSKTHEIIFENPTKAEN